MRRTSRVFLGALLICISVGITLIVGCSSLGSSATVYDRSILQSIKNVFIAPVSTDYRHVVIFSKSKERPPWPTITLKEELQRRKLFTLFIPDTIEIQSKERRKFQIDQTQALEMASKANSDAVIFTKLECSSGGTFGEANASCEINLIQVATGKVIAKSSHNTQWGNSYFSLSPPAIEQTSGDAIKGAIDALEGELKKKH